MVKMPSKCVPKAPLVLPDGLVGMMVPGHLKGPIWVNVSLCGLVDWNKGYKELLQASIK